MLEQRFPFPVDNEASFALAKKCWEQQAKVFSINFKILWEKLVSKKASYLMHIFSNV